MEKNSEKTILITGGAGFIGSHLVRRYIEEGYKVICLDNLMKTHNTINIDAYMEHPNFKFIEHDIIDPIEFKEKIYCVMNFACPVSCVSLQVDPIHTTKSCVNGVINMLEVARKHDAVFIQASSPDVYGVRKKGEVMTEDTIGKVDMLTARACYEEGKRMGETVCMDYRRKYDTDAKIIRIFNGYGPNMHYLDGRVISSFTSAVLAGKDITVYGDGNFTRSHLYVDDLVEGIDRVMKQPKEFSGPINLGNDNEISVIDLAEMILETIGGNSKIVHDRELTGDPQFRRPDITLAKRVLGWEPKISLEEGIKRTIEHYREIGLPQQRVLVFATTFYPHNGQAENAFMELCSAMPNTEFYVLTVKSGKNLRNIERKDNLEIHRIGRGNILGKYLFPWRAAKYADKLNKDYNFKFAWSIMASYGALAALLFKKRSPQSIFILTYDKSEEEKRSSLKIKVFNPLLKYIFKKADAVFANDEKAGEKAKQYTKTKNMGTISGKDKELINKVQGKYTELLNKQEGILDRPL